MPGTFDWYVEKRVNGELSKANVQAAAGLAISRKVEAIVARYRAGLAWRQDWTDRACQRLLTAPTGSTRGIK